MLGMLTMSNFMQQGHVGEFGFKPFNRLLVVVHKGTV